MKEKVYDKGGYRRAVGWFILSLMAGCSNDAVAKELGLGALHAWQVVSLRLWAGLLFLFPVMCYQGRGAFGTCHVRVHALRGVLLVVASMLWVYGLQAVPLPTATAMGFTMPFFALLLGTLLLGERVVAALWGSALVGFVGVVLLAFGLAKEGATWQVEGLSQLLPLLVALLCFAWMDVLHRQYVDAEGALTTMWYTTLTGAVLSLWPAYIYGQWPTWGQGVALLVLGLGGNLLFYSLLRAYRETTVVSLAPLRYLEWVFALVVNAVWFHEGVHMYQLLGVALIVPTTLYVAYHRQGH